jgi:hypothetical protein
VKNNKIKAENREAKIKFFQYMAIDILSERN